VAKSCTKKNGIGHAQSGGCLLLTSQRRDQAERTGMTRLEPRYSTVVAFCLTTVLPISALSIQA
jgi:hypothetical protein